jgi:hypothetical protein
VTSAAAARRAAALRLIFADGEVGVSTAGAAASPRRTTPKPGQADLFGD